MTSLTYVFHNFIIIYHPFCFRKRVEISCFLSIFWSFTSTYIFPIMGGGGGITVFFDNCEWGAFENFTSPSPSLPYIMNAALAVIVVTLVSSFVFQRASVLI